MNGPHVHRPSIALRLAGNVAIWWGVAAFVSGQNMLVRVSRGGPIDWQWDVFHEFVYWSMWAIFAQLIIAVARRWTFDHGLTVRSLVPHLLAMLVVAPVQITATYAMHLTLIRLAGLLPADQAAAWFAARRPGIVWGSFTGCLYYWVIVGVYQAVVYRRLAARLRGELTHAQLEALRTQLHPHFLFNTLNSVSVLTTSDPPKANRVLLKLSDLLRTTLDRAAPHEVSLRQELAQLEPYLEIQQIRFGQRLTLQREVETPALEALVPSFVLQPLVENAVRHGIERNPAGGTVTIGARARGDTLVLEVRDTGAGLTSGAAGGDGIGLANTRARLERLYGARHQVALEVSSSGGAVVRLELPLRTGREKG